VRMKGWLMNCDMMTRFPKSKGDAPVYTDRLNTDTGFEQGVRAAGSEALTPSMAC